MPATTGYTVNYLCFLFLCVLMVNAMPLRGRVNFIEKRISMVETRINYDNELGRETFLSLQQNFEDLNNSMIDLKNQMSQIMDKQGVKEDYNYSAKSVEIRQSNQVLMSLGLGREKQWTRDQMKKLASQVKERTNNFSEVRTELIGWKEEMESDIYKTINKTDKLISSQLKEIEALKESLAKFAIDFNSMDLVRFNYTCPFHWIHFSSYCYLFVDNWKSFDEARAYCKNLGATLSDIENQEENSFIADNCFFSWIGVFDEEKDGNLISERTGQPASFTNFADRQPGEEILYNCVEIDASSGKWYDLPCNVTQPFICKKDVMMDLRL